ncbi:MAG: hypothetical protein IPL52_00005 [Flavobacteriales bacterium]|nr:hypothetical protein [Flavobacteriales bacterium]
MAKSYIGVLTGIAMGEGRIESVFQPCVSDFLPEFKEGCYAKITHCITCSRWARAWPGASGANPFSDNAKGYWHQRARIGVVPTPPRRTGQGFE